MRALQLTLAIIKPHVVSNPVALQDIRRMILENKFWVVRSNKRKLKQEEAELFYKEHSERFFYNRLVTFMSSGPIELYLLAREDAIQAWRQLMGPTKVFRTQFLDPDSIRGRYGLSDTRNATHGSDSEESVRKEVRLFFPKFDIASWYKEEEPGFRAGDDLVFDSENFVHKVLKSKFEGA